MQKDVDKMLNQIPEESEATNSLKYNSNLKSSAFDRLK